MPETTTSTRKKSSKKVKKFNSDEVSKLIEDAEKRAEKRLKEKLEEERSRAEFDFVENSEEGNGSDLNFVGEPYYEDPENISKTEEELNAFDLFEYVDNTYVKAGTPVKYQIKRDGVLMGELSHPCSWTKIQKKWGEGHYTVAAKKRTDNTYIKQQTLDLGPSEQADEDEKSRLEERLLLMQQPSPQPGIDPNTIVTQMMGAFQKMQEMKWDDKKTKERDERKSENQYNTTMLTLMQGQQQSAQQMFMEMQKSTQESLKYMSEMFAKSQERMDDKFTKMFEKLSEGMNKKEQFSTMDLLKMMKEAEDNGWSKMQTLLELADAKAAEKEDSGSSDGMIGKLIAGVLPLLSGAQQQQQMALTHAAQSTQRRSLPPAQSSAPANPPSRAAKTQSQNPGGRKEVRTVKKAAGLAGIPTFKGARSSVAPITQSTPAKEVTQVEKKPVEIKKEEKVVKPSETIDDILKEASMDQQLIAQMTVPVIAEKLMTKGDPQVAAAQCLGLVEGQGFNAAKVLEIFPFDFMLRIARTFGIEANEGSQEYIWFKGFYAYIENSAGMDTQGTDEYTDGIGSENSLG